MCYDEDADQAKETRYHFGKNPWLKPSFRLVGELRWATGFRIQRSIEEKGDAD